MSDPTTSCATSKCQLHVLCAGAVQGLVKALAPSFESHAGVNVQTRFGAVGAMREALLGGEPCDVMIVTDAMIRQLQDAGELAGPGRSPLGRVLTGLAVPIRSPRVDVSTQQALRDCLLASSAIYFPDPERATAGIHFASVIERLGIRNEVQSRVRTFPSGAISMRELASDSGPAPIGCTQITEIKYTPGVALVGALPGDFELATVYAAAATARTGNPELAQRFIQLLSGPDSRSLRIEGGFT